MGLNHKSLDFLGFSNAPEWTRTTTDQAVHKALNLIQRAEIRLPASRSSILRGFLDTLDALDGMDVARVLPRDRGFSATSERGEREGDGRQAVAQVAYLALPGTPVASSSLGPPAGPIPRSQISQTASTSRGSGVSCTHRA